MDTKITPYNMSISEAIVQCTIDARQLVEVYNEYVTAFVQKRNSVIFSFSNISNIQVSFIESINELNKEGFIRKDSLDNFARSIKSIMTGYLYDYCSFVNPLYRMQYTETLIDLVTSETTLMSFQRTAFLETCLIFSGFKYGGKQL